MDIEQDVNNYMQKITQSFPEILAIRYFREFWAYWTIPNWNDMITL